MNSWTEEQKGLAYELHHVLKRVHGGIPEYWCREGCQAFPTVTRLNGHMKNQHNWEREYPKLSDGARIKDKPDSVLWVTHLEKMGLGPACGSNKRKREVKSTLRDYVRRPPPVKSLRDRGETVGRGDAFKDVHKKLDRVLKYVKLLDGKVNNLLKSATSNPEETDLQDGSQGNSSEQDCSQGNSSEQDGSQQTSNEQQQSGEETGCEGPQRSSQGADKDSTSSQQGILPILCPPKVLNLDKDSTSSQLGILPILCPPKVLNLDKDSTSSQQGILPILCPPKDTGLGEKDVQPGERLIVDVQNDLGSGSGEKNVELAPPEKDTGLGEKDVQPGERRIVDVQNDLGSGSGEKSVELAPPENVNVSRQNDLVSSSGEKNVELAPEKHAEQGNQSQPNSELLDIITGGRLDDLTTDFVIRELSELLRVTQEVRTPERVLEFHPSFRDMLFRHDAMMDTNCFHSLLWHELWAVNGMSQIEKVYIIDPLALDAPNNKAFLKDVNFVDFDLILFPLLFKHHWRLLVFYPLLKTPKKDMKKKPSVEALLFDSLAASQKTILKNKVNELLRKVPAAKKLATIKWKYAKGVPQQPLDSMECGWYCLYFALTMLTNSGEPAVRAAFEYADGIGQFKRCLLARLLHTLACAFCSTGNISQVDD